MPSPPLRRFTLFDGMILIAATGFGIGGFRALYENWVGSINLSTVTMAEALRGFMIVFILSMPTLLAWTFAILFLRMRRPRPTLPRLSRHPGLIACLGATLAFGIIVLLFSGDLAVWMIRNGDYHMLNHLLALEVNVKMAAAAPLIQTSVAVAWGILAITGRWRSECSWIDRLGRVIGLLWIVTLPGTVGFWLTWSGR